MKFMKRFCSLERTDYCDEHPLFFTEEASVLFVSCTGAYLALFQFVRGERDGREWRGDDYYLLDNRNRTQKWDE